MEQFLHVPEAAKASVMERFKSIREEMNKFLVWCRENSMTVDDRDSEVSFLYLKMAELQEDIAILFKQSKFKQND